MKILSLSPRLSILLCSAIVASSLGNQVFIAATPLDEQLLLLSKGISSQLRGKGVRRLAIADFSSIDQGQTALTRYLTEQFTTTLVTEQERTFQLVDRNTVLAELKSQNKQKEEGLLDAATLSKFGKLAGVDSVLIGTVTTTSFALELNIKVLEVETGEIHGAIKGAVSIPPIPGRRLSDIPTPAQLLNVLTAAPTASESNSANARPTVVIKETAEQRKLREEAEKEEKRKQQEAEKEAKRQQKARQDRLLLMPQSLVVKVEKCTLQHAPPAIPILHPPSGSA